MSENNMSKRPNILVFFTDQQRWDTCGCYGSENDLTPCLDSLAADGAVFDNAVSCQPVCGPARAVIQTGLYATHNTCYRNAIDLPVTDNTLAHRMNRAGYKTGYVGKWHLAGTGIEAVPEELRAGYKDYWMAADLLEFSSGAYSGFVFDKDNNIVSGDSRQLYTETFRDIKTVKNIQELISLPKTSLNVNDVYYVVDLKSKDYAIVDGVVYDILDDENGYKYISVYTRSGIVTIGKTTFVSEVTVSSPYSSSNLNNYEVHLLDDYQNNTEIRVYILDYDNSPKIYAFGKYYSINNFTLLKNGTYNDDNLIEDNGIMTHYFQLEDIDNKTNIGSGGWIQLSKDSQAYYLINTIIDKYDGNNPHSGHLKYDNGYTYLSYFSTLFKYAIENNEFNEKCYDGDFIEKLEEIKNIGFKHICLEDCEYNEYSDTKVHYFGKIIKDNVITSTTLYDDYNDKLATLNNANFLTEKVKDNVSDIIINTKRMDINFYLNSDENYKHQIKYYDYIVMNYLSQMIPHNMIVTINYCQDKGNEC